jgi:hypothetical protein
LSAPQRRVALLKRLRIRCDLKMRDAVCFVATAEAAERLRRECALRARSGFDAEWLGRAQRRRLTGIAGRGAILSKGSAQFDPYRDDVGMSDVMVWDTERPYHYARWTADCRLLLGSEDRLVQLGQRRPHQSNTATRDLRTYFEDRLPALATVRTERAWEGGMTFGFLAARLLLERWQGD